MTSLTQFAFNSQQVRIVSINNEPWFVASDVCDILEIRNVSQALSRLDSSEVMQLDYETIKSLNGNPNVARLSAISGEGAKRLVTSSRKPQAIALAKSLGIQVLLATREQQTMLIIKSAFADQTPISQFVVHGYQIDLYLAKANIAIECDENGHDHYNASQEHDREKMIKQALGCSFVRFNPDSKSFNVGEIIYKIRELIDL